MSKVKNLKKLPRAWHSLHLFTNHSVNHDNKNDQPINIVLFQPFKYQE